MTIVHYCKVTVVLVIILFTMYVHRVPRNEARKFWQ